MDIDKIIKLVDSFGLPMVILCGIIFYFYTSNNKREKVIASKEDIILQLNREKVEILQKALEKYSISDKENVHSLSVINNTLDDLKQEVFELKIKIDNNVK